MFQRVIYVSITAFVIVLGAFVSWHLWPEDVPQQIASMEPVAEQTTLVTLPPAKVESAGIRVAKVRRSALQPTSTISGRLDYDQDRHVAVKSACDGILTKVLVRRGDQVSSGQVVAVVSSPQLGNARSNAAKKVAELNLARTQFQWRKSLCEGVEELVGLIRAGTSPDDIVERLKDEALGEYREKLVAAYTRSRLATNVAASSRGAASRGAISARLQQQRETEQQTSEAAVDTVLEHSLFEARQSCKVAEAKLADAQLQLEVSLQELNTLLGPAADQVTAEEVGQGQITMLSEVNLVAPIDGTVEERVFSATERVVGGDTIFTIADHSRLWAVADIRESDWSAISIAGGQEVEVWSPAIPVEKFQARVLVVGRRIDPATGAAPLVAKLERSDARLRPGLFIRMKIPAGPPRDVLAVPEQAVVAHENVSFVFVPESELKYRRVDVQVGETENGLTEIVSGLSAGDDVAVTGVFKLKSEMLLAGEEG